MKEIPMRAILTALSLSLAMPMAACSRDASEAERAATIPVTIALAGQAHRFDIQVARTDAEQDRGLMLRTSLPENGALIFPIKKPLIGSFWMQHTLIPIEMILTRSNGTL